MKCPAVRTFTPNGGCAATTVRRRFRRGPLWETECRIDEPSGGARVRRGCTRRFVGDDGLRKRHGRCEQGRAGNENSSLSTSTTQITSASCPDDVKKEKGGTFTCDVKLSGGGKAQVTVTQTSNHNTFSYAFKSGSVVLAGSTVDKEIEQDLADAGVEGATVNCPDEVPVKPETTVTCPVTNANGRQATVSFVFSDSSGTVDSSSVKES